MPYKKKQANPGTVKFHKLIAELPEKREKIKAQIEFRNDVIESQKRVNYKNEFDRLQGAKKLPGLDANAKSRMKELQKKANPGTVQFNKLIAELQEKRKKIQAQIEFRHDLLESQKRVNYKNEFDRLQGA